MAETITLQVQGMTCGGCAATVTRALENVRGVKKASVDLAAGTASIKAKATDRAALVAAVQAAGYDAA